MEFEIQKQRGRRRRGAVVVGGNTIETPGCLLYCRGGAVPHIVQDMLADITSLPNAVQLSLPSIIEQPGVKTVQEMDSDGGIGKFLGFEDFITYLSIQDPSEMPRTGYNEEKTVSVWTAGGRNKIDVGNFLKVLKAYKPTIAECLCDTIPAAGQTPKRIRKSVDRTLKFLDECLESAESCHIFGAIEGSNSEKERKRSAQETAKRPVAGFVIEGFQESTGDWTSLLQCTIDELPKDKPRVIHGMGRPDHVIQAVECGTDLFDSSFPYQVTERGCALNLRSRSKRLKPNLNYDLASEPSGGHAPSEAGEKTTTTSQCDGRTEFEINLNDPSYKSDFSPVLTGCTCYCCTNHTRAYIHHLLVTKEMLAQVLLMMHNFQEYFGFFDEIQKALSGGYFEDFKDEFLRLK